MPKFTPKAAAQIKYNLGQPLTLKDKRLIGLAAPVKKRGKKDKFKQLIAKEKEDYSCLKRRPYRYGVGEAGDVYGKIIALKLMPDGSLWDSLKQGREPPRRNNG